MPVMNSKGELFDERRKNDRRRKNQEVGEERRKNDRRKKDINKVKNKG